MPDPGCKSLVVSEQERLYLAIIQEPVHEFFLRRCEWQQRFQGVPRLHHKTFSPTSDELQFLGIFEYPKDLIGIIDKGILLMS